MRTMRWCAIVATAMALAGCARQVTLPAWQASVQRYVQEVGGGDPVILRNLTYAPGQHGFCIYSDEREETSTDARGILLGHRMIAGRPWFIYLVGLIDHQNVKDIRLAALNVSGDKYLWHVSVANHEAVETYRNSNQQLGRQRFPDRHEVPAEYLGFPRLEDVFDWTVQNDAVEATHKTSGARWRVQFNG